jgi:hypothetical protein
MRPAFGDQRYCLCSWFLAMSLISIECSAGALAKRRQACEPQGSRDHYSACNGLFSFGGFCHAAMRTTACGAQMRTAQDWISGNHE